jgi:hypothetical protein
MSIRRTLWGRARRSTRGRGKAGPGRGRAGCGPPGVARAEPGWPARGEQGAGVWPVRGEQAAGRRRAGKNKKMGGIHKLDAYVPRPG